MRGHDRISPSGPDQVQKRHQLLRGPGVGHVDKTKVTVSACEAVPGEMFERRAQPYGPVRFDHFGSDG